MHYHLNENLQSKLELPPTPKSSRPTFTFLSPHFRFVAVFCFSTKAGVKNSAKVAIQISSKWDLYTSIFRRDICVLFYFRFWFGNFYFLFCCKLSKLVGARDVLGSCGWLVSSHVIKYNLSDLFGDL